jgi:lysophospholipase L1-like esterase
MFSPSRGITFKIGIVLVLFASHLYCVAVGVYHLPPYGVLQKAKRLLTADVRGTESDAYYFQKVSFFDLNKGDSKPVRVVMLGDSITDGGEWAELLGRDDVVNRGIGADTTSGVLNRMDQVIAMKPQKVFLMIGINDLGREIPVSQVLSNCKEIIRKLRDANIEVIVQSTLYVKKMHFLRNQQVNELNEGLQAYCKDNGIRFVDLNKILAPDGYLPEKYSNDGLHLMGDGYVKWKETILPLLP